MPYSEQVTDISEIYATQSNVWSKNNLIINAYDGYKRERENNV